MLMTATIFACPLFCSLGRCYEHAGDKGCCSCCHDVGNSNSSDDKSCPTKPVPPESGKGCQCICGGAVFEDAGFHDVQLDVRWELPVAVTLPAIVGSQTTQLARNSEARLPDLGMNPGRALCCLYGTFLC